MSRERIERGTNRAKNKSVMCKMDMFYDEKMHILCKQHLLKIDSSVSRGHQQGAGLAAVEQVISQTMFQDNN